MNVDGKFRIEPLEPAPADVVPFKVHQGGRKVQAADAGCSPESVSLARRIESIRTAHPGTVAVIELLVNSHFK